MTPVLLWLFLLIVLPHIDLLIMSFRIEDDFGNSTWSTSNYLNFFKEPIYWLTFARTAAYSILVMVLTFMVALPVAFFITALPKRLKSLALLLIVIPLWSNLLFRTYGWQLLLGDDSWFHRLLEVIGILDVTEHIYPSWKAMLLGMICTYLPFMIVPVYLSVEKIDWLQAQVARDLGASQIDAFKETILPQVQPGLIAGMVFVFLPAVGQFVVPDLLGGDRTYLLGNALEQEFAVTGDWPLGAAYCVVALCIVAVGLIIQTFFPRNRREREPIVL